MRLRNGEGEMFNDCDDQWQAETDVVPLDMKETLSTVRQGDDIFNSIHLFLHPYWFFFQTFCVPVIISLLFKCPVDIVLLILTVSKVQCCQKRILVTIFHNSRPPKRNVLLNPPPSPRTAMNFLFVTMLNFGGPL